MRLVRLLPALALAACRESTTSPDDVVNTAPATVVVATDTVVAERENGGSHEWVDLKFPVSVTNHRPDTLRFFHCSSGLEAKHNKTWLHTGGDGCFLTGQDDARIPPGATQEFTAHIVTAYTGHYAEFKGTFPGEYRYRIGLTWPGLRGQIASAASNTFIAVLRDE